MPWDRTRTGAVSSSRGPARWRARGAGAAAVGEAGEAGAGSARRGGAQTAGSGAAAAGSGAVTPGAYGRGGAGGRTHPSPGRRWDAEGAGLDRTLVPGQNPAFQRLGAADPRVRTARPQRGARRTARGRGPERGCDPLRQDRVGRLAGADRGRSGGRKRWLLRIIGGRSWCRLRGMWRHSAVLLRAGAAVGRERYAGATFFSAPPGRIGSEERAGASKRSVFVSTPELASPPRSAWEPHLASAGQHPSRSAIGRTISTVRCARTCWAVR